MTTSEWVLVLAVFGASAVEMVEALTIVLAAVVLLRTALQRSLFVMAGIGVEVLGMILVVRAHQPPRGETE